MTSWNVKANQTAPKTAQTKALKTNTNLPFHELPLEPSYSFERCRHTIYLNSHFVCQKAWQKACQSTWQEFEHENLHIWHAKWLPEMEENHPPDHVAAPKTPQKGARAKRAPIFLMFLHLPSGQTTPDRLAGAKTSEKGARTSRAPLFVVF